MVNRGGMSKYSINGEDASFDDVQTLLKKHQVDLDHDRFLILQGEVRSISTMKAKGTTKGEEGLLEYLEDIIGSTKYQERVENLALDLQKVREEKVSESNKLKILKGSLDSMKDMAS
jgi:structural maintenance of chromosome 4